MPWLVPREGRAIDLYTTWEPTSGTGGDDVPLSDDALAAFKEQRHLRGPLVFCDQDGQMHGEDGVQTAKRLTVARGVSRLN